MAPRFPVLHKFLRFWETKLEGKLYIVKVAHEALITPGEFTYASGEFLFIKNKKRCVAQTAGFLSHRRGHSSNSLAHDARPHFLAVTAEVDTKI